MRNVYVVITAGGSGKRMGTDKKKQYLEISGKPILYHTIQNFSKHDFIKEIVLVTPQDDINYVKKEIVDKYNLSKVSFVVSGGKERQDSVMNGLNALSANDDDIVIIQDGVRPFCPDKSIKISVEEAQKTGASVVGVFAKDTIKKVKDGIYVETLDRNEIVHVQTPQTFRFGLLLDSYKKAISENKYFTDDAGVVSNYTKTPIKFVEGSFLNIKITVPEDILFAEALSGIINNEK